MSIKTSIVKSGVTAMTPTGGSDITLNEDGVSINNGLHVSVTADADYRTRRNLTVKYKLPTYAQDGEYSKDKKSMVFVQPQILASGKTVYNLIRIEREVHPECTAADALDLNMIGAQLLTDSDYTAFWSGGSLA